MRAKIWHVILLLAIGFVAQPSPLRSAGSTCRPVVAPQQFPLSKERRRVGPAPVNGGIVPTGFVNLPAKRVVHGIDVSKYQDDADFESVAECGGTFAYVRLSAGTEGDNELLYRTHWANARAAGLIPGAYHNLSVLPVEGRTFVSTPDDQVAARSRELLPAAVESGTRQAALFLGRLDEVLALDPEGSKVYLPIALDLSARPLKSATPAARTAFAELYRTTACSFIETIRASAHADEPILIFVDAADYAEYQMDNAKCGLASAPVWIRIRATSGLAADQVLPPQLFSTLCHGTAVAPLGRCVMEQYTSFGGFAIFKPGAPLDLDRFYDPGAFEKLLQHRR